MSKEVFVDGIIFRKNRRFRKVFFPMEEIDRIVAEDDFNKSQGDITDLTVSIEGPDGPEDVQTYEAKDIYIASWLKKK